MRRGLVPTFAITAVLSFAAAAVAAELTVGAQVDKTEVAAGQPLTFSVTIAGPIKETPKVQLSSLEGFQVLASGQAHQLQIQGGQSRQSLVLTYTLAPTTPGVHTLGPVKVEYKGQKYETQPIEIKVLAGSPKREEETPSESESKVPGLEGGTVL